MSELIFIEKATPELFTALASTGEAVWLAHPDYPGYFATDDGRIFSARRKRFMKPIRLGNYVGVQVVHREHGLVKRYLHRLVLEMATGCAPAKMQACHNNGNRYDNRVENLRWDTVVNNHADKRAHGTALIGEKNPMAKLTRSDVKSIRQAVASGIKQAKLAIDFGVSPITISRAVRGKTWGE